MEHADRHTHLPDAERMSLLTVMLLLVFALAHFIRLPGSELSIQLPGLYLGIQLGVRELVALLLVLLTTSGADWLLSSHPHMGESRRYDHWLLPGITSWAIGLPLFQLPISPTWWIGFALGIILIVLVLFAEYIVVDTHDLRHPPAAAGLTAVAFALYLVLAAALRFTGFRLLLLLPALALGVFLISLRVIRLNQQTGWGFWEAALITLITVQIATPLYYLPLNPVTYGLVLLGPAYALTNFFRDLEADKPVSKALLEPLVVLMIIWIIALIIR